VGSIRLQHWASQLVTCCDSYPASGAHELKSSVQDLVYHSCKLYES
jgi:hypothetical protein